MQQVVCPDCGCSADALTAPCPRCGASIMRVSLPPPTDWRAIAEGLAEALKPFDQCYTHALNHGMLPLHAAKFVTGGSDFKDAHEALSRFTAAKGERG